MKRLILLVSALALASALLLAAPSSSATLGLQVNPLQSTAKVGAAVYVTGTAPAGRVAQLQVLHGTGGWTSVGPLSAKGSAFRFRVTTSYYGIRTVRVISPRSGLLGEIDGDAMTMRVKPEYTPSGLPGQFAPVSTYRWNPCAPIVWRLHRGPLAAAPLKLVRATLRKVARATGLRFSYAGTTSVVPFSPAWTRDPPDHGLYIGWATPRQVPAFGGAAGLGGQASLGTTAAGNRVAQAGGVVLSSAWWKKLWSGTRIGPTRTALLLHELGHSVGLAHDAHKAELMYPTIGGWSHPRYGAGDLTALQRLGRDQGCL